MGPQNMPEVRMRKARFNKKERPRDEFSENVVQVDRVTRVVAGGKRMRFRATVVVGDKNGKVGLGVAKANDVATAVQKAARKARQNLIQIPIKNETITREIRFEFGAAVVLLKPAAKGTGIIAGGPVRIVANLAGVKNILGKILGSPNKINNLKAIMGALEELAERARQ